MTFVLPRADEREQSFHPDLVVVDDDEDLPPPPVRVGECAEIRAKKAEQRVRELEDELRRVVVPPVPPVKRQRSIPAPVDLQQQLQVEKEAHDALRGRFAYLVSDTQAKLQMIKKEFDQKEQENQHLRRLIQELQQDAQQRKRLRTSSSSANSTPSTPAASTTPKRRVGSRTRRVSAASAPTPGFGFSDIPGWHRGQEM
eukprot:TRINITY_DN13228_c0_g1_i1.p1 TRINITY_DN13228_c0_g1~~TRINITY_DN13228_c0_g1_i1.p1  ORF type:complete len:199 (+),score=55.63 TRINITY_DN13228_c0_g1_i1:34-630(+)